MKHWKNVLRPENLHPNIVIFVDEPTLDNALEIVEKYPFNTYTVISDKYVTGTNLSVRPTTDALDRLWKNADFFLCNDDNLKLEALASGVTVLETLEQLEQACESPAPDRYSRLDNFEKAKKLVESS